jgi:hypothetical protein
MVEVWKDVSKASQQMIMGQSPDKVGAFPLILERVVCASEVLRLWAEIAYQKDKVSLHEHYKLDTNQLEHLKTVEYIPQVPHVLFSANTWDKKKDFAFDAKHGFNDIAIQDIRDGKALVIFPSTNAGFESMLVLKGANGQYLVMLHQTKLSAKDAKTELSVTQMEEMYKFCIEFAKSGINDFVCVCLFAYTIHGCHRESY